MYFQTLHLLHRRNLHLLQMSYLIVLLVDLVVVRLVAGSVGPARGRRPPQAQRPGPGTLPGAYPALKHPCWGSGTQNSVPLVTSRQLNPHLSGLAVLATTPRDFPASRGEDNIAISTTERNASRERLGRVGNFQRCCDVTGPNYNKSATQRRRPSFLMHYVTAASSAPFVALERGRDRCLGRLVGAAPHDLQDQRREHH